MIFSRCMLLLVATFAFAAPPGAEGAEEPRDPLARISFEEAQELDGLFGVYDPAERVNRRLYWFNARADDAVLLPAVRGYEWTLPQLMRTGIRNFFPNLREITTLANSMLQLKAKKTGGTAARFVVNTTIGVAGLWDPASRVGLRGYDEDFGQTLGYWGVPAGAYFVIPLLGPSSVRDAFGSAVDRVPFFLVGFPSLWLLPVQTLDARANNPFRYGDLGGAFEYGIVRFLATERRKLLIAD